MSTVKHTHNLHPSVGKHSDRSASPISRGQRAAKQTEKPSDHTEDGFSSVLKRIPLSLAVTALTGMLFLTVLSLAAHFSPDPMPLTQPLSVLALGLASLMGGLTAGRLSPGRPLSAALLTGGITALILLLLSLLPGEDGGLLAGLLRPATIPIHLLGGIISRPRKKQTTHTAGRHRNRR